MDRAQRTNGRRISTLDLFGTNFTLVATAEGESWAEAARTIRDPAIDAYLFGRDVQDPEQRFVELCGITSSRAALVRPDGFVAWRAKTMSDAASAVLTEVFNKLLIR
jgi:putative polyketide hydroxylase